MLTHIGRTPLICVTFIINSEARSVYLKLEGANPGGSIKDRTAASLIECLEQRGALTQSSILIESTSGNLGVSLSMITAAKGYGFTAVVDPKTTDENLAKMQSFGAKIETVSDPDETGGYLLSRLERVRTICATSPQYVWTNQYESLANPEAHYRETGPEIVTQMHGDLDAVFIAVSTGGTLAGIGRYLRKNTTLTHIIAVDAHGSVLFGAPPSPRKLTGIGSSRQSSFITADLYDDHVLVSDQEAFSFCRALFTATGIKVGGSSGAVLVACADYLSAHPDVERVVCLCADDGQNYDTSIFSDAWLAQHGFDTSVVSLGPLQEIIPTHTSQVYRSLKHGATDATAPLLSRNTVRGYSL